MAMKKATKKKPALVAEAPAVEVVEAIPEPPFRVVVPGTVMAEHARGSYGEGSCPGCGRSTHVIAQLTAEATPGRFLRSGCTHRCTKCGCGWIEV